MFVMAASCVVLCQGELQRNGNLTYHSFLGCEDIGSDLLHGVNHEEINGLIKGAHGGGAASVLSDGGEGYCTLSSLLNLPFHKSM